MTEGALHEVAPFSCKCSAHGDAAAEVHLHRLISSVAFGWRGHVRRLPQAASERAGVPMGMIGVLEDRRVFDETARTPAPKTAARRK